MNFSMKNEVVISITTKYQILLSKILDICSILNILLNEIFRAIILQI